MRERTIIALWKRLAGGQRLRLRVVSVLVIALGSAALLMGPGIDSTARAQTTVDYDGDDDGLIEVTTVAQLGAIRWDLNGDGAVDPGGDAASYGAAFPNAMVSPLMGCATTGCVGYELTANLDLASAGDSVTGWAPIGGASNAFTATIGGASSVFTATFDGGAPGFTVSNLTINTNLDGIGLFGATGPGSVIRNVTLADVNIAGGIFTGALVGGVTFVSAAVSTPSSGQCRRSGVTVTCTLGTVNLSDTASGTIVVEVPNNASADLGFTAMVSGNQLDSTPADNDDSATTRLDAPPRKITNLSASGAAGHINLTWSAPGDNGSAITRYELERKAGTDDYLPLTPPNPAALFYRDDTAEEDTDYTYRLRAINDDGEAEWSNEPTAKLRVTPPPPPRVTGGGGGGGGFGPAPVAPKFADGFRTTRSVAANARADGPVGDPVAATHPDDLEVTYSLSGTDAALFIVDEETGQIRVKEGTELESDRTYTVNLTATDSAGFGAIIIVMIQVAEPSFSPYDLNGNEEIEREEVIAAIKDYFDGTIAKEDVIELVKLYFAG